MDDIVKAALIKWPAVPHCCGWLGLDRNGHWYLRDAHAQASGAFTGAAGAASPASKGTRLQHDKLIAFIQRNYAADAAGQWYFQNGPQRVYVELEATPYIWRLQPDGCVLSHTGAVATVHKCLLDEAGWLYLLSDLGLGLVHSADMALAADAVQAGRWRPEAVGAAELPTLFGYVKSPHSRQDDRADRSSNGGG